MSGWPWPRPIPSPVPPSPPPRFVSVIVRDTAGENVNQARVELDDKPRSHVGFTVDGLVTFTVPAALRASHLWVSAQDFVPISIHLDLPGTDVQVWLGGEPTQETAIRLPALVPVQAPPLIGPHDPALVRCNFGSLWDPVLGRWIFQNMYPSMDPATRQRWREIAAAAGDTHFQIGNPTTDSADYHDQTRDVNWLSSGRMKEWNARAAELVNDGFTLIAYADSGDRYPGAGWHREFFWAVSPDLRFAPDGTPRLIAVAGHEIIPGGYTTKQGVDSTEEIAGVLGPRGLIAMHTGDGRLSWSSNPVEPDDPWQGDEAACWRSAVGQRLTHHFYQAPLTSDGDPLDDQIVGSTADNAHGVITRIIGDHWVDGNGYRAPDWFDGLPRRVHGVCFEQNEELLFKGRTTRARCLEIARAFLAYGFDGYGCGSPEMLSR